MKDLFGKEIKPLKNIYNKDAFYNSFWDLSIFNPCFPNPKMRMGDVDGLIERRGHFLLFEGKPKGKTLSFGQQLMYNNLAKIEKFTVLVCWGIPPNEFTSFKGIGEINKEMAECRNEDVVKFVKDWYNKVDKF